MATSSSEAPDAKSAILARIRAANSGATTLSGAANDWTQIPRAYKSRAALPPDARLHLLMDRLRDYDAEVEYINSEEVPAAIVRILAARNHPSMLMPAGFPADLLPTELLPTDLLPTGASITAVFSEDTDFSSSDLDRFGGILTEATLAIAETGTLVLQNVPGQGRRAATLVPDFHLCIVRAADIVETVPEAIARLHPTAHLPTTFISGPSATADIEMTRIKGVHGPRFLHVLLIRS